MTWLMVVESGIAPLQYSGRTSHCHPLRETAKGYKLHCDTFSGTKWRSKRVMDDLDRRFQRLDPLLAIPGVNVLSCVAEQVPFHIFLHGG